MNIIFCDGCGVPFDEFTYEGQAGWWIRAKVNNMPIAAPLSKSFANAIMHAATYQCPTCGEPHPITERELLCPPCHERRSHEVIPNPNG